MSKLTPPLLMLKRRFSNKPIRLYDGNIKLITESILSNCYKKNPFTVSDGHFKQFYCRDFGLITKSLLELGYKQEVFSTLNYAISTFKKHNTITTTISNNDPVNFFSYGADSLPFLFRSIRLAIKYGYNIPHKNFLQEQITQYFNIVYDKKTHLVKLGKFSSAKDHYTRHSCSYDNAAMVGLCKEIQKINIKLHKKVFSYPISIQESKEAFISTLWQGEYFYDDLDKMDYVASDAQIFPFYWNVITDEEMKLKAYSHLPKLSKRLPIQYAKKQIKEKEAETREKINRHYLDMTVEAIKKGFGFK